MFYICLEIYSQRSQNFSFTDLHITPNQIKSVQFLPRLFSKRPFFVRRQCRACATKIPSIPECIRRRTACSKLVRAMGGRYGEGSRRRPGWRSPSISSKPSGANGRGEGTWQGKVLGCRCKFNVYLALFIRYYIYTIIYVYMMMYVLSGAFCMRPKLQTLCLLKQESRFSWYSSDKKRCHVLCTPLGWDGSKPWVNQDSSQASGKSIESLTSSKKCKKNWFTNQFSLRSVVISSPSLNTS